MAPWKNWISSTTMKLRKSLVRPVTQQNISSCLVLPPEIVVHDAFNVILWTSADVCVVMHNDLEWKNRTTRYNCRFSAASLVKPVTRQKTCNYIEWKNRTTRYNCRFSAASLALRVIFIRQKRSPIYASCMTISGGRTEQHVVIGCSRLEYVDIRLVSK